MLKMIDIKTKYFILGTLFSCSLYLNTPIFHIISVTSIYYFIYTKTNEKFYHKTDFTLELQKLIICFIIFGLESRIMKYLQFRAIMRIGVFLIVLGFGFSLYSNYYLLSKKKLFVFSGPYKYMRHPFYFGCLVMFCGCVVYLNSYCMLVFVVFTYKNVFMESVVREEEEMLKLDSNYKKYMNTVKMFWF